MIDPASAPMLITVPDGDGGERLDRVLARLCPQFSRSALQRWIDQGRIEQAGEVVSRKTKAQAGAEVSIEAAPPEQMSAKPQDIPLEILFEDEHLLLLDKPAGLVVHPAPGHPDGTLVNALLHHGELSDGSDPLRPGIVHRLDKDTSGVMVVAKSSAAHERLVEMFQAHALERAYLAIVRGRPPAADQVRHLPRPPPWQSKEVHLADQSGKARGHTPRIHRAFAWNHPGSLPSRDRTHAPDSCASRGRRPPGARRFALRPLHGRPASA